MSIDGHFRCFATSPLAKIRRQTDIGEITRLYCTTNVEHCKQNITGKNLRKNDKKKQEVNITFKSKEQTSKCHKNC